MFKKLFAVSLALAMTTFALPSAQAEQPVMIGGQRDQHGCLSPAGYTWSKLQSQCIRIWEAGEKVADVANPVEWAGSYAVFSQDGNQVELFLADQQETPILEKQDDGFANADFKLQKKDDGWQLFRLDRNNQNTEK